LTDIPPRLAEALRDRYRLERELGRGGMGAVYLAEDLKHHRKVAVKVLRPDLAASLGTDRFLREIEVAAQLQHPTILPLHDSGQAGEYVFYIMPYVEGESLRDRLARQRELPLDDAVRILCEVLDALAYAHGKGVIHRDIKPDNIMLTREGVAKLCDLGLAKLPTKDDGDASGTRPGASMGTPYYIAPEQARGEQNVDTRADIYSLGSSFYHMVAGEVPFVGQSAADVISKHLTEPVTPPRVKNPLVSGAVDWVIVKMLQKAREDRYQTPTELVRDLEAIAQGGAPEGFVQEEQAKSSAIPKLRRGRLLRRTGRFRRR